MNRTRLFLAALVVVGASSGSFVGCVGDDASNSDAATNDATTGSDAGGKDASGDGATGCAARTADDTAGIFIAQTGEDVSGCGARSNSCKTLQYGIAAAKATTGKTTVYVASGSYQESIVLDAPITIEGGWKASGSTWTPVCDATTSTTVTIQG